MCVYVYVYMSACLLLGDGVGPKGITLSFSKTMKGSINIAIGSRLHKKAHTNKLATISLQITIHQN